MWPLHLSYSRYSGMIMAVWPVAPLEAQLVLIIVQLCLPSLQLCNYISLQHLNYSGTDIWVIMCLKFRHREKEFFQLQHLLFSSSLELPVFSQHIPHSVTTSHDVFPKPLEDTLRPRFCQEFFYEKHFLIREHFHHSRMKDVSLKYLR